MYLKALVAIIFTLSACSPKFYQKEIDIINPSLSEDGFMTRDGSLLPVRIWTPEEEPIGVIIAVHGFNDYSNSFDRVPNSKGVGPSFASMGYVFYAYDQRGFGQTENAGFWAGRDSLTEDFLDFLMTVDEIHNSLPVYAIGVSMGGAVIISAVSSLERPPIEGIALVAPAVWGRESLAYPLRIGLWLGNHTVPWLKLNGKSTGILASDNIQMLAANGKDKYFIKETRIDSIYGLVNLMDNALERVAYMPVPTIYLYGANDQVIPAKPTYKAVGRFLSSKGSLRRFAYYKDGWHTMLRDVQGAIVLNDIASFFSDYSLPLPSGADQDSLFRLNSNIH